MNRSIPLPKLCGLLLLGVLAGCGHGAADDDDAAAPSGQVAVTTVMPTQQAFHDTVEAWGSAIGDPDRPHDGRPRSPRIARQTLPARGRRT